MEQSAMMQQIYSIPGLMREMEGPLRDEVRRAVENLGSISDQGFAGFRKVYLTGCGDSYCAAVAAKFAFLECTDMDAEAVPVIDLSRYYQRERLAEHALVVIISNSGTVARCIELAERVRLAGGTVLAVTGNEQGGLYQNASEVIKLSIPRFLYAPGIRSYCGCLMALYMLALEMGYTGGTLPKSRVENMAAEMASLPGRLEAYMEGWDQKTAALARDWKGCTSFEIIGSGVSFSSAAFGCAKALETTGKPACAQNAEEWFHMNFFVRDVAGTGTIVLAGEGQEDESRVKELYRTASLMGRPIVCITDSGRSGMAGERIMEIPAIEEGIWKPLIQYLPISMLFSHLGDELGEVYFRDGKDNWSACVDCATLIQSEIVLK